MPGCFGSPDHPSSGTSVDSIILRNEFLLFRRGCRTVPVSDSLSPERVVVARSTQQEIRLAANADARVAGSGTRLALSLIDAAQLRAAAAPLHLETYNGFGESWIIVLEIETRAVAPISRTAESSVRDESYLPQARERRRHRRIRPHARSEPADAITGRLYTN
ncbi:MAG: hypothetical protein C5B48_11510 [Candidatus Rokuibacteriota bacterium]|nr:MAG: hypothetical protein C5B48_11510 [Candidatus Rokubacteria bacterium]